jgi:hypothetical protein
MHEVSTPAKRLKRSGLVVGQHKGRSGRRTPSPASAPSRRSSAARSMRPSAVAAPARRRNAGTGRPPAPRMLDGETRRRPQGAPSGRHRLPVRAPAYWLQSARGENDIARLGPDQGRDLGPRLLDDPSRGPPFGMDRRWIATSLQRRAAWSGAAPAGAPAARSRSSRDSTLVMSSSFQTKTRRPAPTASKHLLFVPTSC